MCSGNRSVETVQQQQLLPRDGAYDLAVVILYHVT